MDGYLLYLQQGHGTPSYHKLEGTEAGDLMSNEAHTTELSILCLMKTPINTWHKKEHENINDCEPYLKSMKKKRMLSTGILNVIMINNLQRKPHNRV